MGEQKRGTNWLPLARITLFLVLAVLTGLFGALMGVAIVWAWLSLEHGAPVELSSISPESRFAISTAIISGSYPLLVLLTFAFMRRARERSLEWFGLVREGWLKGLVVGFLLGAVFVAIMFGFYATTGLVRFELVEEIPLKRWLVMSLWLCPLIGLTEELIFRGYLMSVAEEWRGRKFAVVFTSLLFWLAHLGQGNAHELLGAAGVATLSVTFAFARYLSGGLWLPIGLHAGYDWMALSFGGDVGLGFPALTRFQPNVPSWLVGPSGHVGVLDLAFYLALLFAIVFLLPRFRAMGRSYRETTRN
jgi:membrane protease YdiL (CAAX protease family)